jgi:hypothetical protein
MSAPKSNGRWKKGDAKVLSTSRSAPARCAISADARRSVMRISGLVGVSTNTIRVAGVIASAMRCGSRVST